MEKKAVARKWVTAHVLYTCMLYMCLCRTDITPGQISLWIFLNLVGWKTGVDCNKTIKHVLYTCTTKQICHLHRSKKCLNDQYSEIKTSRLIKACAILVMGSRDRPCI